MAWTQLIGTNFYGNALALLIEKTDRILGAQQSQSKMPPSITGQFHAQKLHGVERITLSRLAQDLINVPVFFGQGNTVAPGQLIENRRLAHDPRENIGKRGLKLWVIATPIRVKRP